MRKTITIFLTLVLCAAMFAGCAGGGTANAPQSAAPSESDSSNSESDSAPQSADGKELTVMCPAMTDDGDGKEFRDYVNEQLGVNVRFEAVPLEYSDTVNKVTTMFASGDNSVDVYHIDEIMQLAFLSAGFLEPIDDVVTEEDLTNFLPGYSDMFMKRDGKLYSIPADIGGILFFVNKKMFDEANIAIPTNEQEFIAAAQALTKDGKYGLQESWDKASHLQDNLNRWCLMFGGNFYDWTLEGSQKAIKFMYDLVNTYKVVNIDNLSDAYESGNQKMADGMAAMYFQWAGAAEAFKSRGIYGSEIVTAPIPTFTTNKTPMSSWMWVVNRNSSNIPLAKEYIKLMVGEEAQSLYLRSNWKSPTANVKAWDDSSLMQGLNNIEEHKQYLAAGSLTARTLSPKHSEYMDTVTGTLQRYLLNEISYEECLEKGQQQIEKILASSGS